MKIELKTFIDIKFKKENYIIKIDEIARISKFRYGGGLYTIGIILKNQEGILLQDENEEYINSIYEQIEQKMKGYLKDYIHMEA